MPLGDSITEGTGSTDGAGYRSWLNPYIFPPRGFQCDFVGSLSAGPDTLIDKQHEGHPAKNAAFIRDNVRSFLEANPPQVVFLMIGTNDIQDNRNPNDIRDEIGAIIDNIFAFNDQIEIYLSTVTTRLDKPAAVTALNNLLPPLVLAKQSKGTITLVEMPEIPASRMADNVHPNDRGYEMIAEAWFDALSLRHSPSPVKFRDDFNRASLGTTNWAAHPDLRIQNNQLVNVSSEDSFDFLAIAKNLVNPRVVSFEYGSNSAPIGRAFTGVAVMLDQNTPASANGYLLFFRSDLTPGVIQLFEIRNGQTGTNLIDRAETLAPPPDAGDQFQVEIGRDAQGHKFTVTISTQNGIYSSTLRDNSRLQGRGPRLYSGVMINGATVGENGVDNFFATTESDLVSPGDITNLQLKSASSSSLTLTFNAPGDDGNIGAASLYDVRYSQGPITANNFGSADRAAGIKTPGSFGTEETITISDLQGNTEYYVAIRAYDEVGNASKIAGGTTPYRTAALASKTDRFERTSASGLGREWTAGAGMRIVSGTVQTTGAGTHFAVLKTRQNVQEISLKLGPQATEPGGRDFGILVLADTMAAPTGYLIRRLPAENGVDKIGLFFVQSGAIVSELQHETAVSGLAPQAGSIITVEYTLTGDTYTFTVNLNGVTDRIFPNVPILEGKFAGFMLEGLANPQENAIDEFTVAVPIKAPSRISKVSGDNQLGSVGQPLENPLVVKMVDEDGNPVAGKPMSFEVSPAGRATIQVPPAADGGIRVEAETGTITGPLETRADDDASRGSYVSYPNSATLDANVKLTFTITTAGTYRIWTRSRRTVAPYGVWSVRVDNGALFTYEVFQREIRENWDWDLLSEFNGSTYVIKTFDFTPGQHTIEFNAQRKETHLDKILVIANPNFTPSGLEDPGFTTNGEGIASAEVVFGSTAGAITISAKHANLTPVSFTATATGGAAATIQENSGNNQSGGFGKDLAQPFIVTVRDAGGNVVANHKVSWVITAGDGKLSHYLSTTDINGRASTLLTLGVSQAANKVEVRSVKPDGNNLSGLPIVFSATANSGQPATLARFGGNAQTGQVRTTLANEISARVTDSGSNAVANVPLRLTVQRGGGALSATADLLNGGFENAETTGFPRNWLLENNPSSNEVKLNTTGPKAGTKTLEVNSARTVEVGVSQSIRYAANTNYVLTFWAKVINGTARVRWQVNDASGAPNEKLIDITRAATGNNWVQYRLIETNARAGNRSLSFTTDAKASNFLIDDVQILPATNSAGRVNMSWTLGDTAGTQQISVAGIAGGTALSGSPVTFTATATAGAAAQLQINSGNNQVGSVNQALALPFVAKVADVTGVNGVAGVAVKFTVKAGGGKLEGNVNTVTRNTNAQGLAQVIYTLGPNNNVQNIVEAAATGLNPATVNFTATAAIPGSFAFASGNNQRATAGRAIATPLGILIKTSDDKPIAGYPVKFEVLQNGGTINNKTTETIHTGADGIARAILVCAPTPGAALQVRASATSNGANINGSPKTFNIRTHGLKNLRYESGDNQSGVVGNFLPQPLVMSVLDSSNAKVPGQKVKFEVTAGGGKLEGDVALKEVTTDTSGRASIKYKLGTQPVENKVAATITPALPGSPRVFKATAQAAAPDRLVKFSGDSAKGVVGNPMPAPFVARITDQFGNGVAGLEVIFRVVAGGGNLNGQQRDTVKTNAEGKAAITLTLGSSTNGAPFNNVVEARAFNGSLELKNSPARFYATATASRARAMVNPTGNRQTGRAGNTLPTALGVRINDANNNPVPDHPVKFQVVRGGGKFPNGKADTTVITNANGVAAVKYTLGGTVLPDSQVVTATATDGTGPLNNSPTRFVEFANAGLPSQNHSRVTTSTSTAPADGATEVNVIVEVADGFGNPVANETVIIEVTNPPNNISQPQQKTNAQGRATGRFSSTKSGAKVVTAYIPSGIAITNGATVQFTPLDASRLSLLEGNNQTGNINTAVTEALSVRVLDRNGNGVPNHGVTFRVHSGVGKMSNGAASESVLSDANGVAQAYFVFGGAPGESQIRAESQGLINSPIIFLATAVDRPARNLAYVSGNEQTGIVGETLAQPIVVKVTDANGKAVYNKPVNFQVTFGGGSLSASTVATNEFGEAKVNWRLGQQAGLNTVRVSAEGLAGSPFDFSAQAVGGRACCVANAVPGGVVKGPVGGQSGPIQVRVIDDLGNGIDGYSVEFELVQGTGALTQTRVQTQGGGFAATRLNFDNVSGFRKVRAVAGNLSGSPLTISVYAQPASATSMNAVPRTNNQGGTVGKPLNFPLQVKLLDSFGNPAVGEAVDFVVTAGGGSLNGGATATAVSDSSGIAEARLTLGSSPGQNRVNAVKKGGSSIPPVTFTATAHTNNFPIFADVPDQKIRELDRVEFVVTASDADGDGMTFGARNLPPGAAFDSTATRTFTWKSNYTSAGVYEPEFIVRDGRGGIDIEIVRIEVADYNRPPRMISRVPVGNGDPSKPDTTLLTGPDGVARFTMRVNFTDDDPEDRLSYRWEQNGQAVGTNSSTYDFVGVLGVTFVKCTVFDDEDEVSTEWAMKVPVALNTFSASAAGKAVTLQWSTSAESNNAGFHVHRSLNAGGPYTRITTRLIPPRRDGEYTFIDKDVQAGNRYYYKLEDIDAGGKSTLHGPVQVQMALPEVYELSQNYPNPFNPTTTIQFQLPRPGVVRLFVYNSLGQVVARLANGMREAGYHTVLWNGRDLQGNPVPSGVYHYRLESEGLVLTKKMVLAK